MKFALFAAALTLFAAPAFANGNAADSTQRAPAPSAAAPAAENPAPQVSCQAVKFIRSDVSSQKNQFMIEFHGADAQAIKACNPDLNVHRTKFGVGVVVNYGPDSATVNLPQTDKDGRATVGRCVPDATGGVADAVVYEGTWSDGLPDHVEFHELDPAYYNKAPLMAVCEKLKEANQLRQ